ncbi:MAG: hypothetical protein HKN33_13980 [Pyrinomonadaceae bacterium]|nr:hypothetical protein [Pyrinomonadaceae bacterium]
MENTDGKTALGLDPNVGALICYVGNLVCSLGLIYSIIVLVTDKTNKLPRFHAFQSILLSVVGVVVGIGLQVIGGIFAALDIGILSLLLLPIMLIFALGMLAAFIFAAIKAFQGEIFKLPVIGNMADQWSD